MPSTRLRKRRAAARGLRRQPGRTPVQRLRHVAHLRRKAGTPLWRGPNPRRQLTLALAPVVLLLLLFLAVTIGRRYTAQKLNVETTIRAQLIPTLEKELGKKVEVGAIESDYFSRIVLRDVVIGRDKNSPLGALLQAKSVTASLDVVNLVLHRDNPLLAITRVVLDAPQVDLRRDAGGQLNVSKLLKHRARGGAKWRGLIEVLNGRVYYEDLFLRSARGRPLRAEARGVTGFARFNGNDPVEYSASLLQGSLGAQRAPLASTSVTGTAAPDGAWFTADVNLPNAPAPLLTDYAFRRGETVAQSGTVRGRIRVMWERALPRAAQFTIGGRLVLQNVSGFAATLKEPGTAHPLALRNINGVLRFADKTLQAQDVALVALGTPLRATGNFTFLPRPLFDLKLASENFDSLRLFDVFRKSSAQTNAALAANLDRFELATGRARGVVQVAGDPKNWTARGEVALPATAISHPRWGAWHASTLLSTFKVQNRDGRFAIRTLLKTTGTRGAQSQLGAWQANGTLSAHLLWTNATAAAPLQVRFSMPSASGRSSLWGAWRGDTIHGTLRTGSTPNAPLAVQIAIEKLAGRHPQWGMAGARGLSATVNFRRASTPGTGYAFTASAQSAVGDNAQWGRFQSAALRASGSGDAGGGAFSLTGRSTRARNARFGAGQASALDVFLRWNGSRITGRWNARDVQAQNAQAGDWRAAKLIGTAEARSTRGELPVRLDVEARDFSGLHARYGGVRGAAARAVASSPDAHRGAWSGTAALGKVDASRANLAALSPALARQVRTIGDLSGKFRFSGLPGSSPVVKGRARLSRVVVQQGRERIALRDLETDIAFGGQQVRLSELRAQSDFGPLQAELQSDLAGGRLRLSILAPRVTLTAAQINEYLKPAGLHLSGTPQLRLRLSAASSDFAKNETKVYARFQLALPLGNVQWAGAGSTSPLGARLQDARLQGDGAVRFTGATDWTFDGRIALDAAHAATDGVPGSPPNLLRAADFHLDAHGSFARTPEGLRPRLAGTARAQSLILPVRSARVPLVLQAASAEFIATPQEWQVPRFIASGGGDSRLIGHAALRLAGGAQPSAIGGQVLLEKFDATRARALLIAMQGDNANGAQLPEVSGTLFARADFSGVLRRGALDHLDLDLLARLYNGSARWMSTPDEINELPIDAARLATTLRFPRPANAAIPIAECAVWSAGARLAASGVLTPRSDGLALDISASVHTLRLRHLLALPQLRASLQSVSPQSGFDGLLSGEFKIEGDLAAPRIAGRAALRLAQGFGFEIEEAAGDLALQPRRTASGANTFFIGLTNIEGRIAGADLDETANDESPANAPAAPNFSGEFIADGVANEWHLALHTGRITTSRLLLAAERTGDERTRGWRDLPLSGSLSAGFDLSGTLRADDGHTQFQPRTGEISVQSGGAGSRGLRWKGRDLGVLTARLQLRDGVLQVRQFELSGAPRPGDGNATPQPLLQVSGVLPVSLDTPDLDARLQIENQQLSFVIEVLREIREALAQHGQNVTYLDAILHRIAGLPPTIEGRIGLDAHIEQSWHAPVVAVNALHIDDFYFLTASGTRKTLPDLTAAFVYDGNDNGAVAIRRAELRLPKAARGSASTRKGDEGDYDEDLLIRTLQPGRIVPGGEMSLEVEVLNADLEQLADWVPTLRSARGRPIVRGRLTNFVVQLGGTTGDPQLTGSLLGEDWRYQQYTLDRVRLDKFTIANGQLRVEPGFLTVVKGDFQSAAAWGFLPWSWGDASTAPGLVTDRPLEVHFPVGKENFGALAGIFVPAIQNVGADTFSGEVTLGGTIAAPRLAGEATITNGTFRVRSAVAELDAGVAGLSGSLRFVNGNRLEIGEGGLRGRLVPANTVEAPQTGNAPSAQRRSRDERAKQRGGQPPGAPRLAGDFLLQGGVTLDLDPRNLLAPRANLAAHHYDLKLAFAGGAYSNAELSGVREVRGAVLWQTGAGDARHAQQVRWVLEANGAAEKTGGRLVSFAALRLAPDFGESFNALMRSRSEAFFNAEDFHALDAAWSTLPGGGASAAALQEILSGANGAAGRVELSAFRFDWKDVARGTLGGRLLLDNGASPAPTIPLPSEAPSSRPARAMLQPAAHTRGDVARVQTVQPDDTDVEREPRATVSGEPLRLSGDLTLQDAELYGAPEGGSRREADEAYLTEIAAGASTNPIELWPNAPVFNVRLKLGNDVAFVSSNLTATITGELMANGTPREPTLLGTVYTRSGQIAFPNARARLVSGELNIAARRDPLSGAMRLRVDIDATARGRSGRYDITLRLRGPLDTGERSTQDLRVDVTSDPPLSSDEAFAQLLGTAVLNRGGLEGGGNETYARAIVGLLSGPLFSGIERSIGEALGLDTIALDYHIDEPIGIEIGKAIGDRLYISYRRTLQHTSGQKMSFDLRIEYRLKGNLELGLETNELDERKITLEKRWRF